MFGLEFRGIDKRVRRSNRGCEIATGGTFGRVEFFMETRPFSSTQTPHIKFACVLWYETIKSNLRAASSAEDKEQRTDSFLTRVCTTPTGRAKEFARIHRLIPGQFHLLDLSSSTFSGYGT